MKKMGEAFICMNCDLILPMEYRVERSPNMASWCQMCVDEQEEKNKEETSG